MGAFEAIRRFYRSLWAQGGLSVGEIPVVGQRGSTPTLKSNSLTPTQGAFLAGDGTQWVKVTGPGGTVQTSPSTPSGLSVGADILNAFVVWHGANVTTANRYLQCHGRFDAAQQTSGALTRYPVPIDCKLVRAMVYGEHPTTRVELFRNSGGSAFATIYRRAFSSAYAVVGLEESFSQGDYLEVHCPAAGASGAGQIRVVCMFTPTDLDTTPNSGMLLGYGSNVSGTTNYLVAHGLGTYGLFAAGDVLTEHTIPYDGTIDGVVFSRATVASGQVVTVEVVGGSSVTASLPAAGNQGYQATGSSLSVSAGDAVRVRQSSGTVMGNCIIGAHYTPTASDRTGFMDFFAGDPASAYETNANYVPSAVANQALVTTAGLQRVATLLPAVRTWGEEGNGERLKRIVCATGSTSNLQNTTVRVGTQVRVFDCDDHGSVDVDLTGRPNDLVTLSPGTDEGDTMIGLYYE